MRRRQFVVHIVRERGARGVEFAAHAIHRIAEFVKFAIVCSHRIVQRRHQVVDERKTDLKFGKAIFK